MTWVPDACTLPTIEQPLRVAEFDDLFAKSLRGVDRLDASHLRLALSVTAGEIARELTVRESSCCSFFEFTISERGDEVELDIRVPPAQVAVLDAIAARATAALARFAPGSAST